MSTLGKRHLAARHQAVQMQELLLILEDHWQLNKNMQGVQTRLQTLKSRAE